MAVLAAILPIVSRSSALALDIYKASATSQTATDSLLKIAKSINNFGLIVKQVGTIVKEDDSLPSAEAFESLEDVLDQATAILDEIETFVRRVLDGERTRTGDTRRSQDLSGESRILYLVLHLDSLRWTLAVMLQTLHVAQSIIWAKSRPTISPKQCAAAVDHERQQLEVLIIEQQMSILQASSKHSAPSHDARLLMEDDSSQSLVSCSTGLPQPNDLVKYQDTFIASLSSKSTQERQWLPAVSGNARSQLDGLLYRWSRLRHFEDNLANEERRAHAQKREMQQPSVDSDSEEEEDVQLPKLDTGESRLATPTPGRPGGVQPLFTETSSLPIPVHGTKSGPTVPISPASSYGTSPRSSRYSFGPGSLASSPASPSTSFSTIPVEAAAAVEANDQDSDVDLGIPWTLRTRRNYWNFIDGQVDASDTKAPYSDAYAERQSWTEIAASWVCKEAIKEAGLKYRELQKEIRDGRRTKLEPCFYIEQPLLFDQVRRLVERTVDLYRKSQATSARSSLDGKDLRPYSSEPRPGSSAGIDRDRTPVPTKHAPLQRSTSTFAAHAAPPLDRTISMPSQVPMYEANPRKSGTFPQGAGGSVPHPQYSSPQTLHPSNAAFLDPRVQRPSTQREPSYQKTSRASHYRNDYSTSGASDSDAPTRSRRHRSSSRRPLDTRRRKKDHSGATKALMGVAGLTALLDGLVGI